MNEPLSFKDPSVFPVVFKKKQQNSIMFGQNVYPITFKFNSRPRLSNIETLAADVRGFLMVDRDVGNDLSVGAFYKDTTHRIELFLDSKDPEHFNPFIQIRVSGNEPMILKPGNIAHVRQASSLSDIEHIFSMEPSTQLLDPISSLYATASLDLSFSNILRNNNNIFENISLPDKDETLVLLKPSNASGILDIIAELKLNWYKDQLRTVLYTGTPPLTRNDKFGIRFYITDFGLFLNRIQIANNGEAIVNDVPPQSYLDKIGQPSMDVIYFGNGTRSNDLFMGIENGIEVDDSGLPIQSGEIVPAYILENRLEDIESSSSSSSSSESSSSSSSSDSSSSSESSLNSSSSSPKSSSSSSVHAHYFIDFEDVTKTTYTAALRTINGIEWMLDEALIGTSISDKKNELKSLRLRGSTSLQALAEMRANKTDGLGTLSFYYARYGTNTLQPNLYIEYSTNNGSSWTTISTISPPFPANLTLWSSPVNINGNVRIRFRTDLTGGGTSSRMINIDDILLTEGNPPPQYICVSGAGISSFNGTYEYDGTGTYYIVPGAGYEVGKHLDNTWWFDVAYIPDVDYYHSTTAGGNPVNLTFTTLSPDLGTSPTISEGQCP